MINYKEESQKTRQACTDFKYILFCLFTVLVLFLMLETLLGRLGVVGGRLEPLTFVPTCEPDRTRSESAQRSLAILSRFNNSDGIIKCSAVIQFSL